ncbi:MAG: helix-turn-helix transcriptional regulator [Solirubrobacteraceae bacterium]
MTRVNDPGEFGHAVQRRRRELDESQERIADVTGVHRASIVKLESGAGGVRLQIALLVVQTLGLNVELVPRNTGVCGHACCQRCASRGRA